MLASFPAGLHLHICPEGQIWNQDHKPQDHLQELSCVNKQCGTQNRHWRQLIIDVLLDECYVHDGWGEGQLDVTPRQSINKSASGSNNNKAPHVEKCPAMLFLSAWEWRSLFLIVCGKLGVREGQHLSKRRAILAPCASVLNPGRSPEVIWFGCKRAWNDTKAHKCLWILRM